MTLNSSTYLLRKPEIATWIENKSSQPHFNLLKELSYISIGTGVPIIIVTHFVIELVGSSPELEEMKVMLMKFYGVEEVV